jgi:hypothetical protein
VLLPWKGITVEGFIGCQRLLADNQEQTWTTAMVPGDMDDDMDKHDVNKCVVLQEPALRPRAFDNLSKCPENEKAASGVEEGDNDQTTARALVDIGGSGAAPSRVIGRIGLPSA